MTSDKAHRLTRIIKHRHALITMEVWRDEGATNTAYGPWCAAVTVEWRRPTVTASGAPPTWREEGFGLGSCDQAQAAALCMAARMIEPLAQAVVALGSAAAPGVEWEAADA